MSSVITSEPYSIQHSYTNWHLMPPLIYYEQANNNCSLVHCYRTNCNETKFGSALCNVHYGTLTLSESEHLTVTVKKMLDKWQEDNLRQYRVELVDNMKTDHGLLNELISRKVMMRRQMSSIQVNILLKNKKYNHN